MSGAPITPRTEGDVLSRVIASLKSLSGLILALSLIHRQPAPAWATATSGSRDDGNAGGEKVGDATSADGVAAASAAAARAGERPRGIVTPLGLRSRRRSRV